ncbi:MAG: hypothetical protein KC731_23435 [Myxococcales bacterium]|nr:hypothetical protein [Myxococcales bacterium]
MTRTKLPMVGGNAHETMPAFLASDPHFALSLHLDEEARGEPGLIDALEAVQAALEAGTDAVVSLAPHQVEVAARVLGEGEVEGRVFGRHQYHFWETALPGVWRVETLDEGGRRASAHLEVAPIPAVVLAAGAEAPRAELPPVDLGREGLMNAAGILTEIRHHLQLLRPGAPNHVISFSLMPLSESDMTLLEEVLGRGPVDIVTRGFGTCRVQLTGVQRVWSVQHFGASGNLLLDTLEIGDVPAAALAAPEDLADAAVRLASLLQRGEEVRGDWPREAPVGP